MLLYSDFYEFRCFYIAIKIPPTANTYPFTLQKGTYYTTKGGSSAVQVYV